MNHVFLVEGSRPGQHTYDAHQVRDVFAPTFIDDGPKSPRWTEPPLISPERQLTNYPQARRETKWEPISAFAADGSLQIVPRVFPIDLSVAHNDLEIQVSGNVLWYMRSTNVSDLIQVRYNDRTGDLIDFQPGNAIGGVPFDRLYVTNSVIAGAACKIILMQIPNTPLFLL